MNAFADLSREELLSALEDAQADAERARSAAEQDRLMHDLRVHQIELEMQNRELRKARSALEAASARYAELYDLAPVACVTLERDGCIREANLTATSLFGLERAELIGRPLSAFTDLEDRPALRNHVRRCFQLKALVTTEVRLQVKGLGPVSFQVSSTPVLVPGSEVTACKTAITDVSQLKRSEQRLRLLATTSSTVGRSFELVENLAEVARSLVPFAGDLCFIDLFHEESGEARRVAAVVADPAKSGVAEALRRPPTPRAPLSEPAIVVEGAAGMLSQLMSENVERDLVVEACGADSLLLAPLEVRGRSLGLLVLVMAGSGRTHTVADLLFAKEVASRAAAAIDNARRFRAEERSRRRLQSVLGIVAHELKVPLSGIHLCTDQLIATAPPGDGRPGHSQLGRIKRSALQLQHLIDDLIDSATLETGRLPVDPKPLDAGPLVDEAVDLTAPLALEKGISLIRADGPKVGALCDRDRVVQVLSNLIGNALKFTPAGGKVTVMLDTLDDRARFCVRDTGPGLPKAVMLSMLDHSSEEAETGARGLSIARSIVESQRGTLWVENNPKQGTSLFFTLPLAEPHGAARAGRGVDQQVPDSAREQAVG